MTALALDSRAGWERFRAEYWEKKACKIAGEQPVTPETAFTAAVACADHERATKEVIHQVTADAHYVCEPRSMEFLARATDRTLAAYLERAQLLATTGVFSVNHLKFQAHAGWGVWGALVRLLAPMFEHVGFPYGGTEASLVVGANLSVLPALQTWSKWEPTAKKSGHLLYVVAGGARVAVDGAALDASTGDLLYVPSRPQMEAALEGLSAVLVINIEAGSADERADRMVRQLVIKNTYPTISAMPYHLQRSGDRPEDLPPVVRDVAAQLRDYSQSTAFAEQLVTSWLCLESGLGFAAPPIPDAEHHITRRMLIRGAPTLRWTTIGSRLLAAANGHALRFPSHVTVQALLQELTAGTPSALGDLVEKFSADETGPGPEDLFELLQSLYEIRGVELVAS